MPLELLTIPARSDNYAFIVHDAESGATAVIDVPDAAPVQAALVAHGWTLTDIWLTHHHGDHTEGVAPLRALYPQARVSGAAADAHRLPALDRQLKEGDSFSFGGEDVQIFEVSGHTLGHIAFYMPGSGYVFTADSLMALGCGRVNEGTHEQMWESLSKLAALPPETVVCSGHEYTANNAKFALTIEPGNEALKSRADAIAKARAKGTPTVPSSLSDELATNPFLRAGLPSVKAALGMQDASNVDVFTEIRQRKDRF
ncbi:hydroxyacylglutathione hydrolase [Puniceibacterium sediminis]|uniref:Hydroxyacylglutathione hydrolase n=1 Tax=Puniceibacterium sediminis TaxID=1608407 RepID=A0A238WL92_9RHOB|nr:hydroxyacylglutathione hydrolase [Puniceibacterium sediminis]SNR47121.1 hydroxyacylglutathione hydrolase [Puniceibacterium sediminis]